MRWAARYVGLPYADDGETGGGFHCWSFVRTIMHERAGIELPTYGDTTAAELIKAARYVSGARFKPPWLTVPIWEAQALDVAVMLGRVQIGGRLSRVPNHCGIMASPTHLLHIEQGTEAVLVPISHPSVKFRLVSFHRHEALADASRRI